MANEDTDQNEEFDEPEETDAVEQSDLPDEIPSDPEELKAFAAKAAKLYKTTHAEKKELQSEAERQKERAQEQKTRADWLAKQWENTQQQNTTTKNGKRAATKAAEENEDDDDVEVADLVVSGTKSREFVKKLNIVTKDDLDEAITKARTEERQLMTQQTTLTKQLVNKFPDLVNPKSKLSQAVIDEMVSIDEETPGLQDTAKFKLAVYQAAERISYQPKGSAVKQNELDEQGRERLRRGQGAIGTRSGNRPGGQIVITDQIRKDARKMGLEKDEDIRAALTDLEKNRQSYERQARAR